MSAGKTPTQRQLRIGEEIRHALVRIFAEESFRDPALQNVSITVSEARAGPDLKTAKVFVLPLGGQSTDDIVAALNRAAGYLRGQLARRVQLKFTPALTFLPDQSYDAASAISDLLHDERVARDIAADGKTGTGEDGA